jgi:predicted ATPase
METVGHKSVFSIFQLNKWYCPQEMGHRERNAGNLEGLWVVTLFQSPSSSPSLVKVNEPYTRLLKRPANRF